MDLSHWIAEAVAPQRVIAPQEKRMTKIEARLESMERKIQRGAYHTKRRENKTRRRWWALRELIWRAQAIRDPRW